MDDDALISKFYRDCIDALNNINLEELTNERS